jgi:enediyne biosynthesis protein E4
VLLINEQGKKFNKVDLPEIMQISTINDVLIEDLNNDEHLDMIVIGNNYAQETLFGRYDASIGTVLLGDGKFHWKEIENRDCVFVSDRDARAIIQLKQKKEGEIILIINNNGPLQSFAYKPRANMLP